MRSAFALLLLALCSVTAAAHVSPADSVPLQHPAYEAVRSLSVALDGAFEEHLNRDRALTRYEFGMIALRCPRLLSDGEIGAEDAAAQALGATWRGLAEAFLPEMIDVGEDLWFLRRDLVDLPDHTNGAIAELRAVPPDHWLYPDALRVLWAAADLQYEDAPRPGRQDLLVPLPPGHWIHNIAVGLLPLFEPARHSELRDRGMTRYELAMLATSALRLLERIEAPPVEADDLGVRWALLSLAVWPEITELYAHEPTHVLPELVSRPRPAPLAPLKWSRDLTPDHWLYPTVLRVWKIGHARHGPGHSERTID